MLDEIIKGGTVVDGTGAPSVRADVGIKDGRIVAIGDIDEPAERVTDATGCIVAPGFVDPHTHYDAQLMWDPTASPSSVHGVTTVVGGNCGFSLAPLQPGDADYLRKMMAKVEGMPLPALEQGTDWEWETFGQFLDRFEGNIAVNAGFLAGHCAIRRYVMGPDAIGNEATPEQIAEMRAELGRALDDRRARVLVHPGRLALRRQRRSRREPLGHARRAHRDVRGDRQHPAPRSRASCRAASTCSPTTRSSCSARSARRPTVRSTGTCSPSTPASPTASRASSAPATAPPELGGRLVALTMPVGVPMNMSFLNFCALWLLPGWQEIMGVPVPERIQRLADPDTRLWMLERSLSQEAGVFRRLADWGDYRLGDVYAAENEPLRGRTIKDIAAERGKSSFGTLLDIVIADDLRTVLWPVPKDDDGASWELRRQVWDDPGRCSVAPTPARTSTACAARPTPRGSSPTASAAVSSCRSSGRCSSSPARRPALFGLKDRGVLREGAIADVVVFDPETVGSEDATLVRDLPGDSARLTAGSHGVVRVLVSGTAIVEDGKATGKFPALWCRGGDNNRAIAWL